MHHMYLGNTCGQLPCAALQLIPQSSPYSVPGPTRPINNIKNAHPASPPRRTCCADCVVCWPAGGLGSPSAPPHTWRQGLVEAAMLLLMAAPMYRDNKRDLSKHKPYAHHCTFACKPWLTGPAHSSITTAEAGTNPVHTTRSGIALPSCRRATAPVLTQKTNSVFTECLKHSCSRRIGWTLRQWQSHHRHVDAGSDDTMAPRCAPKHDRACGTTPACLQTTQTTGPAAGSIVLTGVKKPVQSVIREG